MTTRHTIPAYAVRAALISAQLRTRNQCDTPLLVAYTRAAPGELGCEHGTAPHPGTVARARAAAQEPSSDPQVHLMSRGYILAVIQRYRNRHGLAAVRKTFGGAGIRQLMLEAPYILNGSADDHPGATT